MGMSAEKAVLPSTKKTDAKSDNAFTFIKKIFG
jgi:hypothetical protein